MYLSQATACTFLVGRRGEATETKKNVVVGAGRSEKRMNNDGATEEMRRDVCFSCSKWMSGFTQKGRARVEGLSESTTIPLPNSPLAPFPCLAARTQRLFCCPFAKTRIAGHLVGPGRDPTGQQQGSHRRIPAAKAAGTRPGKKERKKDDKQGRGESKGRAGMENGLCVVACHLGPRDDDRISFVWTRREGLAVKDSKAAVHHGQR